MKLSKHDFIQMVQVELDHLKEHATPEEKENLNFDTFSPFMSCFCIYGQLTGFCYSDRARELYPKKFEFVQKVEETTFDNQKEPFEIQDFSEGEFYTPLEKYLYMIINDNGTNSGKHMEVIQYIKGQISTIDLNVI